MVQILKGSGDITITECELARTFSRTTDYVIRVTFDGKTFLYHRGQEIQVCEE